MDPIAPAAPTMGATDTREPEMWSTNPHRGRTRAYVAGCLLAAVVAAVGGVALLTGGHDKPVLANGRDKPVAVTAPTTPAPASTSPAPTSTVSTRPKPEDVAAKRAKARYRDYLRVSDQVANGGYTNLKRYDTVAIDPETGVLLLGAAQLADITTTGKTEVVSLTVKSVKLNPPGDYPSVRLLACLDVSQLTAVNAAGESVVSPDRPDLLKSEAVVKRIPPGAFTDGRQPGWYVAEVEQRGDPC